MRCPKCRAAVVLEAIGDETAGCPATKPAEQNAQERIQALEERVAKLEEALAAAIRASTGSATKLKWLAPTSVVEFSALQAEVLRHNLSTISAHRITIQTTIGDATSRQRAEWFKDVFQRASWSVCGPEEGPAGTSRSGLSLATTLPVPAQAAATFLALRAAGFPLETAFDPDLPGAEERLIVA